jgi:predicted nucleotidyltransferase
MNYTKKEEIITKLKELKLKYEADGFVILGLFGSYSRDEQNDNSDIDILIDTKKEFLDKYCGFRAFVRFDEIKNEMKTIFHKEIDFVDRQGLLQRGNDYILKKAIYV